MVILSAELISLHFFYCEKHYFCKNMLLFRDLGLVLIAFVRQQEKQIPNGE